MGCCELAREGEARAAQRTRRRERPAKLETYVAAAGSALRKHREAKVLFPCVVWRLLTLGK